jgi:reactive intermediate/imine deaminase
MTAKRLMIAASITALVFATMAVTAFTQKQKGSATERRYINLPGRPLQAPFSDAVMVGDTLYLAGWIGIDPKTNKVPEDIDQEVRLLLDHFKDVLAEAGMTMDDLVTVQVFCPDLAKFDQFNAIYRTYFKRNFPARAFIGSGPLLLGGHFEMQATAVKGK